jgi:GNAT superfamily N-acetyltransferase
VPSTPDAAIRPGWWHCVATDDDGAPVWFALAASSRLPDATRVELPVADAERAVGGDAVCVADYDADGRVVALRVGHRGAPSAPPLWFVEIRESTATPPAVSLVAFTGHGVASGILLADTDLAGRTVASSDQLGAVRWYPASGEVDQIYVQPRWRRRTIGGALVGAAAALSYARGWPRLWGDGQRTALGEQFRNASTWRHRTNDLTHVAAPMTPGDA